MHNTKRLYKTLIEQLTGKRLNIYISLCMPVNIIKKIIFILHNRCFYCTLQRKFKYKLYQLVIGRGVQGTICTSSSTANVVNLAGLAGAGTIAHEVFHK